MDCIRITLAFHRSVPRTGDGKRIESGIFETLMRMEGICSCGGNAVLLWVFYSKSENKDQKPV